MEFLEAHQLDFMLFMSGICGILAVLTVMTRSLSRRRKCIYGTPGLALSVCIPVYRKGRKGQGRGVP